MQAEDYNHSNNFNPEILETEPDCEIRSSRVFKAPIEDMFTAWSDPLHLANWWGPAGFTNTFEIFDFRPGGKWKFVMHGPEKGNYQNECVFIKIEQPTLIAWNRISKPIFQVVATFEKLGVNKTRLVFRMLFHSAEECNKLKKFVVDKNEENFDKLEVELLNITRDQSSQKK